MLPIDHKKIFNSRKEAEFMFEKNFPNYEYHQIGTGDDNKFCAFYVPDNKKNKNNNNIFVHREKILYNHKYNRYERRYDY